MPHILVIEDDIAVRAALLTALGSQGYATSSAGTGLAGLQAVVDGRPDLIVLDLGLPDISGVDLLRMLRAVNQVPVIVATAQDQEASIVSALDAGADDYLVKPFGAAQLAARARAVLRRRAPAGAESRILTVGDLVVDVDARRVTLEGATMELTPREFDLLAYLAERPGRVISRGQLLADVWQIPHSRGDKTVDVHLSWLRSKMGESARAPRYLHTIRGVGVRLAAPAGPEPGR